MRRAHDRLRRVGWAHTKYLSQSRFLHVHVSTIMNSLLSRITNDEKRERYYLLAKTHLSPAYMNTQ